MMHDWLTSGDTFDSMDLAVLWSESEVIQIRRKVTLISDSDDDADIRLQDRREFAPAEGTQCRVVLRLANNMQFYLENFGTAPAEINGAEILPGQTTYVEDYNLIIVGGWGFIFRLNQKLIELIQNDMKRLEKQ
jgi:hypothetical protein